MKRIKRLAGILLATVMTLAAASVPAMAGTVSDTCTVYFYDPLAEIALLDEADTTATPATYVGYQLLTLTTKLKGTCSHTDEEAHESTCYNYAYELNSKYSTILITTANNLKNKDAAEITDRDSLLTYLNGLSGNADATRKFADAVYKAIKANTSIDPDAQKLAINASWEIDQGYWLFADVTEYGKDEENTVKSLVLLDTKGESNLEVTPKQSIPQVDKQVSDKENGTYGDTTDVSIGDTVYFKITGTLPQHLDYYETYKYIFHDTLSNGLTLDAESIHVSVKNGETVVDVTSQFTKPSSDQIGGSFTVRCSNIKGIADATVTSNSEIVLTYSATLNENAVIGNPGNPNKVYLEYSNDPYDETGATTGKTPEKEVKVYTYKFDLVKTDSSNKILSGAEFKLYNAKTGGSEIKLVKKSNGDYRVATPAEKDAEDFTSATIEAGNVTIKGLDSGTYWLEEITAPAGYNMLKERVEVKIDGENLTATLENALNDTWKEGGVHVVNQTGAELPSTGGMGTTIFYAVGGVLVLGAAVLLVTRKRMSDKT